MEAHKIYYLKDCVMVLKFRCFMSRIRDGCSNCTDYMPVFRE